MAYGNFKDAKIGMLSSAFGAISYLNYYLSQNNNQIMFDKPIIAYIHKDKTKEIPIYGVERDELSNLSVITKNNERIRLEGSNLIMMFTLFNLIEKLSK